MLAKHFLWLHQNRGEPDRGRFLVEGRKGSEVIQQMRVESGHIPVVAETIKNMADEYQELPLNAARAPGMDGIALDLQQGRLFVTSGGIVEYYRKNLKREINEDVSFKQATDALRTLASRMATYSWSPNGKLFPKKRWHEIDLRTFLQVVEAHGWSCSKLVDLMITFAQIHGIQGIETAEDFLAKVDEAKADA